ncbi:Glycosyl transferase family 2 [Mucilaginibacter pineti]|uniref:Glycosyl transferase family 2 n=1 Tax=Mucilaginibacter pineti TaxID=1391627 RepID=A0A1G6ZNI4_9SPHI|nr:glycosyltransferase family A protein [Mucilaginibacter pineti]SDE03757.1 Glycosyl transferase family 2 [Mucilaginibacter pineti]
MEGDIRVVETVPLVSVIIPVYNAGSYLATCIESVLSQTWHNLEIIVVDDGSTDNSYDQAKQFLGNGVKLIRQYNAGAGVARNTGLDAALGSYIQFLDADDFLSPDKIASQLEILKNYPDYVGLCCTVFFNDHEDPHAVSQCKEWYAEGSDDPVDFLIKLYGGYHENYGGMIQPNAWLTPRHIIDKAGRWTEERNPDDDGEFFCRVLLASAGVRYSESGLNYYRKSTTATMSNRGSYSRSVAVLNSWISKSKQLKPFEHRPGIRKALAFNFTELCYQNYAEFPDLSRQAYLLALSYGGLAHPPYLGNKLFNKLRFLLPWKVLLLLQKYYHWIKAK